MDHDGGSGTRQAADDSPPDSPGGTGHDDRLSGEVEHLLW